MARQAVYQVNIAGQDISSRLAPLLMSLEISDKEGRQSDTARITIDDRDQVIRFPTTGDHMTVALGWEGEGFVAVFEGTIDEVQSSGSRGGGRILSISAKGVDTQSKAKQAQQLHIDNADVQTALNKAGEIAGIKVKVDPELAKITREWWGLNDESFLAFGQRIANEIGGVFKVKGNQAILTAKTGGTASGGAMPSVTAAWGVNLIAWDIKPVRGRPRHNKVRARYYDRKEAKWKETEVEVRGEDVSTAFGDKITRADVDEAKSSATSKTKDAEREKGGGSIEIDGTAQARPGGTCVLAGARAGVDGSYRIEEVSHSYTRSGWTTRLSVKLPSGGAGRDER